MGEYAIRKSDGERVKIGTCENMYYLRYEDRDKVRALSGNVDPVRDAVHLRFRIPFPDEDHIQPGGNYEPFRGQRLYRQFLSGSSAVNSDFTDESTLENPGTIQLRHEASGLLLNVPCYHGIKLPEVTEPMRAFWNGKGHSFELAYLRQTDEGVKPIVQCRHCQQAWRYDWADIWDYIPVEMRLRLDQYRTPQKAETNCHEVTA